MTPTLRQAVKRASAALLLSMGAAMASAASATPFASAARVDETALDSVRGGFTSPASGLHVSFGVQRAVYIDGTLASSTADAAAGTLVQRGSGNGVAGSVPNLATVVQNTLDNQKIRVVTTIDVQTDGWRVSRSVALQSAVGLGIAASLRR